MTHTPADARIPLANHFLAVLGAALSVLGAAVETGAGTRVSWSHSVPHPET
jgi:hypothetical protein